MYKKRKKTIFILLLVLIFLKFLLNIISTTPLKNHFKMNISSLRYDIKCDLIFEKNLNEMKRAEKILKSNLNQFNLINDNYFIFNSSMCSTYNTLFTHKLNHIKISQEELNFPIAFAILTYQHVEQIHRLLQLIYRPHNFYCIHIDAKSSTKYRHGIESIVSCLDNVFIASTSEYMVWGEFSILQAELTCMKDLLEKSKKWKYLIHMSGDEMPLKTNYELVQILTLYNGTNEIGVTTKNNAERYTNKYVLDRKKKKIKKTNQTKSPPPHNYTIYEGCTNVAISRDFVHYVMTNRNVSDLIEWSKDMLVPDEM